MRERGRVKNREILRERELGDRKRLIHTVTDINNDVFMFLEVQSGN